MSTSTVGLFLRHLAISAEVGRLRTAADRNLLVAYEADCDQAAFTELMRRYGPLVLRTCRRVLGSGPDAEDAFQAAFILLARQAGQLSGKEARQLALGGWLHRVAYRTAVTVLRRASRRRTHERQADAMSQPDPDPVVQATWNEVRPILDEELDALPDEPRRLLIACYLQRKTYSEAAAELGLPRGSVAWRLERARALLAERLVRRGVALSASLAALVLGEAATGAGVPAVLLVHTVEAARIFTHHAVGVVSQQVAQMVKAGLATTAKGWSGFGLSCYLGLALAGVGLLACCAPGAWLGEASEGSPPAAQAAEQSGRENEPPARADCYGDLMPPGAIARLGTMRLRHAANAKSVAFTPDGKGLLTSGGDNLPRLWDAATGKLIREFTAVQKLQEGNGTSRGSVSPALLSPDGRVLAVRGWPVCSLYLLETATGNPLHEFPRQPGLWNLAFSPDSKTIAAQFGDRLELRDVASGKTLWREGLKDVVALAFSPDGKILAASPATEAVRLYDASSGKLLQRLGPTCSLTRIAFSPDSRTLVLGCVGGQDPVHRNSIHLWDVATGRKLRQLSEPQENAPNKCYYCPVFSPDGKIVAARSQQEICLWDAAIGKKLRCFSDIAFDWSAAAFSPDGKTLAALDGLLVRFWDVATGQARRFQLPPGHEGPVNSMAFMPDGQTLISFGADRSVRWWDTTVGAQQLCLEGPKDPLHLPPHCLAGRSNRACAIGASSLAPNGRMLAVADVECAREPDSPGIGLAGPRANIRLLDGVTGKELRRLDGGNGRTSALTFSPDGKALAELFWAGKDGPPPVVRLWDLQSSKLRREIVGDHARLAGFPIFSPNGQVLITLEGIRTPAAKPVIGFWEIATGKKLYAVATGESIQSLALSPQGDMLATGSDRISLYPISWGKPAGFRVGEPRRLAYVPRWPVTALAFSHDGRMLASTSDTDDRTIRVWETAGGTERTRFEGHRIGSTAMGPTLAVTSLCSAPDGRRLASGSADSTILIWDLTGRLQDGRLRQTSLSAHQLEKLWADLLAPDAARAGRALWALAGDPKEAVPFLTGHLQATAEQAHAGLARVPQLLRDLDSESYPMREEAQTELAWLGEVAEPALRQALAKSPSPEMRRRLELLISDLENKRVAPTGELLRAVRALEVLEQIGTAEARQALKSLTAGKPLESLLTQAAHAALDRLERP